MLLVPIGSLTAAAGDLIDGTVNTKNVGRMVPLVGGVTEFSFFVVLKLMTIATLFPRLLLSICADRTTLVTRSIPSICIVYVTVLVTSMTGIIFGNVSNAKGARTTLLLRAVAVVVCNSCVVFVKV